MDTSENRTQKSGGKIKVTGMTTDWKKWGVVIAAIGLIYTTGSLFCKYHDQFADAAEMYKIKSQVMQVDSKIVYFMLTNQAAELQKRLWELEDRYKCSEHEMPQTAKEEYRRLRTEREELLKKAAKYEGE